MEKTKVEIVFQVGCVVNSVDQVLENLRTYFELEEETIVIKSSKERAEQDRKSTRQNSSHIRRSRMPSSA